MSCYMCKSKKGPFQMLEVSRLRFIRKAQPHFRDDSFLCPKCFDQFELIYKSKAKSKSRNGSISSLTSISNESVRTVSTNSHNSGSTSRNLSAATAIEREDGNSKQTSQTSSLVHFDSRSIDSPSSIDSTDRIVRMAPDFISIRDSTRKTIRNANLNVARQGAEAAVQLGSQRPEESSQVDTPPMTPPAEQGADANNDNNSSLVHFDSRSIHSTSSNDTMDRIVQMVPNFVTLRDSSRKTKQNPELNVARQEAEAAVQPAPKRRKTTESTPKAAPKATGWKRLQIVDEESEDEDIASQLSPTNLAHVRPIVRRRKEPVVQQFDDIMDLYIARTSGG
ncbi:uncharacterized protein LOC129950334 [Eupeodes corollae]|uniref:uncharacterized protein LOC129950334 n=1 Tax=Eupeodes corollae TaxID=290404 RepID=UPI002492521B|nr:uncharacterized protein LOC129950334 [Eupeodes corollae]